MSTDEFPFVKGLFIQWGELYARLLERKSAQRYVRCIIRSYLKERKYHVMQGPVEDIY